MEKQPIVVYHSAAIGNWQAVVTEQLTQCRDVGLNSIRFTHVGGGEAWVVEEGKRLGLDMILVRADPNIIHYETFGILEVERLAKEEKVADPILYFHTKGVSNPWRYTTDWRKLMMAWVIGQWRENMRQLSQGYDAIGVNWISHGQQHFSGNFWMANPDWIRKLPFYPQYHADLSRTRYTCEMWIGAQANPLCRAFSLGCSDTPFWDTSTDFTRYMPK